MPVGPLRSVLVEPYMLLQAQIRGIGKWNEQIEPRCVALLTMAHELGYELQRCFSDRIATFLSGPTTPLF